MNALNLKSLQVFVDVIAHGSFTAAAEHHEITQPAVSFHIRQLEERFGVALIERIGRRAIPTAAGSELLRHATRIDTAVEEMIATMTRFVPGNAGRLRIGTGAIPCIALLPPILRALRSTMPFLEITVMTGNSLDIVRAIEEDHIDVGIVTLPVAGRRLATRPLLDNEIIVLAPVGMELPDEVGPMDLLDHPPILFVAEGVTRTLIDTWFANASVSFHPAMSLGSVEAILELVQMGLGCALLSRMALKSEIPAGTSTHRLTPPLRRTIARATLRDRAADAGLDAFIALLDGGSRDVRSGQRVAATS